MTHNEQYWRAKTIEAQEQAAAEYRLSRHYAGLYGRIYQSLAYETHLKAMARLGWAEAERNKTCGRGCLASVFFIDHDPGSLDRSYMHERWTLDRRATK